VKDETWRVVGGRERGRAGAAFCLDLVFVVGHDSDWVARCGVEWWSGGREGGRDEGMEREGGRDEACERGGV